jgi:antirestriction protein ArdC
MSGCRFKENSQPSIHDMPTQSEIRQQITDQIIDALKSGSLPPWRQPWTTDRNAGFPTNVASKRRYSGVNPMIMRIAAQKHGFRSRWWATYRQWRSLGGEVMRRPDHVAAGHWGTSIVFWRPIEKTEVNRETGEEETRTFGLLRQYHVFNLDQVSGNCLDRLRVKDTVDENTFVNFEPADRAIAATEADIRHGGDQAFYRRPSASEPDFIQLPHKGKFSSEKEYYATTLHELLHWSEVRLKWTGSYTEGELRAEIGACYALSELGVPQSDDLSNHQAYVQNWLSALERDPRCIFAASSAASKAADFVLSFSRETQAEGVEDEVLVG